MAQDPFNAVRRDVEEALAESHHLFQSWQRISQTVRTRDNEELLGAARDVRSVLSGIEGDLQDLESAITASERNSMRYGLSMGDIQERKRFLRDTQAAVQQMRMAMRDDEIKVFF